MNLRNLLIIQVLATVVATVNAQPIQSIGSGHWNTNAGAVWGEGYTNAGPRVGNQPTALSNTEIEILAGHIVTYTSGSPGVGGTTDNANNNTNDFTIGNNNILTLNGGIFAHANSTGNWVRIGNHNTGTLDIKDGSFYLPVGNVQVGIYGAGKGIIRIGDGLGAAGSAVLNLRDTFNGTTAVVSGHTTELNLGSVPSGTAGLIVIESDGVLEGAGHTTISNGSGGWTYSYSMIRVGRYAAEEESAVIVKNRGKFNVRGNFEIAAGNAVNGVTSKGLIHLDGVGSTLTHSYGEMTLAYNGEGRMIIENGAQYIRLTNAVDAISGVAPGRNNQYIGRNAAGVGIITLRTGGKYIRDTGGAVGDLFIGTSGTGIINIDSGGEFINRSTNWDWIASSPGSRGMVYVNEGGLYSSTASVVLGRDAANATLGAANGLLQVDGGNMNIGDIHIGQNGIGLFNFIEGIASVGKLSMGRGSGTGTANIQAGELTIRGNLFIGGDNHADFINNTEAGSGIINQTGGKVTATNAISIGLTGSHTAEYNMTGGELVHLVSDTTIGEKGTGRLYIGKNASFIDQSNAPDAFFFVGREDGSNGTVIVDGYLEKTNDLAGIRVGHGTDRVGFENNTTAVGLLGGTGQIKARGGVTVGNHGTITGGTITTVGTLRIDGGLNLTTSNGSLTQSTLFVNFDANSEFGSDRIIINGALNISGAKIDGTWDNNLQTGVDHRYWVIINEDENQISGASFTNMVTTSSHADADMYWDDLLASGFVTFGGMEFAVFMNANYNADAVFNPEWDYLFGNDVMLIAMGTVVPEPAVASLFCLGLGALVMRRRRRPACSS